VAVVRVGCAAVLRAKRVQVDMGVGERAVGVVVLMRAASRVAQPHEAQVEQDDPDQRFEGP
jgi:hypothetical protein